MDISHGLPPAGSDLIEARAPLAVPVHRGDHWSVYRRVTF
jgi:hypothetical protein